MWSILTGLKKSTWSTSRKCGCTPAKAYVVEKASSNALRIKNPPKIRPWMFLCCGWQIKELSRQVSLIRMLSLSANAGISQKILPSANNALSLSESSFSKPFLRSALFFFLSLFLSSASSQSIFSVCSHKTDIVLYIL